MSETPYDSNDGRRANDDRNSDGCLAYGTLISDMTKWGSPIGSYGRMPLPGLELGVGVSQQWNEG